MTIRIALFALILTACADVPAYEGVAQCTADPVAARAFCPKAPEGWYAQASCGGAPEYLVSPGRRAECRLSRWRNTGGEH